VSRLYWNAGRTGAARRVSGTAAFFGLLLLAAATAAAQDLPKPVGYVNDFANVISAADEQQMTAIMTAVAKQTPAEMAVVTVPDMNGYGSIEQYGIALADAWGVGSASEDAGVILILALQERQVRIEVGYGLEGALPDGKTGGILDDYVLPDLRNGDYGAGLLKGVQAIAGVIADEYGVTLANVDVTPQRAASDSGFDPSRLFYLFFVLIFFGGRFFFWPLLFAGRRRGFFGGGFGSGGFGGSSGGSGFSGFGGGGFGGGGASRGF